MTVHLPTLDNKAKLLQRIQRGRPASAARHWMVLSALAKDGELTSRVAPNGQLEFLRDGVPVKVGP